MGRTPTPEDLVGLAEGDLHAMRLAISLCLANDPPDPGGVEQITDMLDDPEDLYGNSWRDVARHCVIQQQTARLNLSPGQYPPCSIDLAYRQPARDLPQARLLRKMLHAGISRYHPDPMGALRAKRAAGKVVKLR